MKKLIKTTVVALMIVLVSCMAVLFYAFRIEPYLSVVKEYKIGEGNGESIRIVQISDVQISENYTVEKFKNIVRKINSQEPDIIVFTGDLYENYAEYHDDEALIEELSNMEAVYGKYAIWGNRDYGGGCSRKYESILQESGITLLENSSADIATMNENHIYLGGIDDYLLGNPQKQPLLNSMQQTDDIRILLLHEPDAADDYADAGFDFILSGHSHGGQVVIPFMRVMTTSMAEKYIKGFYQIGENTKLYVNTGIGTSHYPIRFLVPPEITVFDILLEGNNAEYTISR